MVNLCLKNKATFGFFFYGDDLSENCRLLKMEKIMLSLECPEL